MSKGDQVIEEKVLTFKTVSAAHSNEVVNFIVQQHPGFEQASEEFLTRLYSITNLVMIPALKSQWSFALYDKQSVVGVYIQIDLLDYLKTAKLIDQKVMSELFDIQQFQPYFDRLEPSIKRGDYLLSIFNVAKTHRQISEHRKQLHLIHQGLYLCKLGGWKNILFQTNNPIPFLKISAEVVKEGEANLAQRKYLMKVTMNQFNLNTSPFQKIYAKL